MTLTAFQEHVASRLRMGAHQYEGRSYERPLSGLLVEILEECADVTGWATIARRVLTAAGLDADEREAVAAALDFASDQANATWSRLSNALQIVQAAECAHRAQLEAEPKAAA